MIEKEENVRGKKKIKGKKLRQEKKREKRKMTK